MKKLTQKKGTFRLFLGIFIPNPYLSYFNEVVRFFDKEKRNLKNIPTDQLHITIKFIGAEVSKDSLDQIVYALSRHKGMYTKPEVNFTNVQFGFPYQYDPRVIMVNVQDTPSLLSLSNQLHDKIKELKLRDTIRWKDKQAGSFHVTLTRLKPGATRSTGKKIIEILKNFENKTFPTYFPTEVYLVSSELTPQGPVYRKLNKILI